MLPFDEKESCSNCEHLRIDNFCLTKGKYILTRNTDKRRECPYFELKTDLPLLKIKKKDSSYLISQFLNKKSEINED